MTQQPVVGILHPGSMGAAVAACAAANAATVLWCAAGRSAASAARAERHGLRPVATLAELLHRSDIVLGLCPPAAAEDMARDVAAHGFTGVYVEANAIDARRTRRIADLLGTTATVVDGGVIGAPPLNGETSLLYLSGPQDEARRVAGLFAGTAVEATVLGSEIGRASALKLSYAAFQKVSRVLVALSYGLAREHGVERELRTVAARRTDSYLCETEYVAKAAARAWRWGPEMEEIADMLAEAGLPPDMLRAAAATLARWNEAKDDSGLTLSDALDRLAGS
ncbi:6-phosphogluconate dehydrogenase [Streptomyces fumigatiscleroticus]|nr:6-phosphogluconate dehydrogenase [Streptomyces fumigatiscleroticus]